MSSRYNGPVTTTGGCFVGGNNHGSIQVVTAAGGPDPQPIETKWRLTLPLTKGCVEFVTAILGLLAAVTGGGTIWKAVWTLRRGPESADLAQMSSFGAPKLAIAFAVLAILVVVGLSIHHTLSKRVLKPASLSSLPAAGPVRGDDGKVRLALYKFGGECRECGGKLRVYNKATAWRESQTQSGRIKRVVTERTPVAECVRNPRNHVYLFETTIHLD